MQVTFYKKDSFNYYSFQYERDTSNFLLTSGCVRNGDAHTIEVCSEKLSNAVYDALDKLFRGE